MNTVFPYWYGVRVSVFQGCTDVTDRTLGRKPARPRKAYLLALREGVRQSSLVLMAFFRGLFGVELLYHEWGKLGASKELKKGRVCTFRGP